MATQSRWSNADGEPRWGKIVGVSAFWVVVLILVISWWPMGTIGAGGRGVVLNWSAATGGVKQPGLYFRVPIQQHVVEMNVQVQKEQVVAEAASHDLQTVKAEVALNYHLDATKVVDIYKSVGEDYKVKLIDPALQEAVKSATANYTAEELITKREQVRSDIKASLTAKLDPLGLLVDEFNVVNFDFSDSFNQAIEAKVTAEQNALAAKNKLDQVQYEAQQRIAQADGEAKAIAIQSQAVNSQGGAGYVQLQAIEKWDGHLPQQMIPGSTVPFINLTK